MDDSGAVQHDEVLSFGPAGEEHAGRGDGGGTGAQQDDLGVGDVLALQREGVQQTGGGDDGGAVLVVVEDRDVQPFDQPLFDLEALRGLDILQVDAAEGGRDVRHGVDEGVHVLAVDFDIEYVDPGKAFEQHGLAFHDRLGGQRAAVAQAEDGGAVGDHGDQIAFVGVAVGQVEVFGNGPDRRGDPRGVGQGQVLLGGRGLGDLDGDFSGGRMGVVFEGGVFQFIRHGGYSGQSWCWCTGNVALQRTWDSDGFQPWNINFFNLGIGCG